MNLYPEYEYKCPKCDGTGTWYSREDGEVYQCNVCRGSGAVLTRQGRLLIDFIERHIKLED